MLASYKKWTIKNLNYAKFSIFVIKLLLRNFPCIVLNGKKNNNNNNKKKNQMCLSGKKRCFRKIISGNKM